ncbi:MAG: amidohydrolase family protein [Acidobacteriaceae bacterium]
MAWPEKMAAVLWVAVGSSIVFGQAAKPLAGPRTLVRAGHLLDVKTGKILDGQTIVVTGDTISSVAASSAVPAQPGDTVVDLANMTVMPGLIDVHTHITGVPNFDPYFELTQTDAKEAIQGVVNARTTLMAGFTTIRNVGAGGYTDVDLRDAINQGQVGLHP